MVITKATTAISTFISTILALIQKSVLEKKKEKKGPTCTVKVIVFPTTSGSFQSQVTLQDCGAGYLPVKKSRIRVLVFGAGWSHIQGRLPLRSMIVKPITTDTSRQTGKKNNENNKLERNV